MNPQSPYILEVCKAVANELPSLCPNADISVDPVPVDDFSRITSEIIRVTPYNSAITTQDRTDVLRMDAQITIGYAAPMISPALMDLPVFLSNAENIAGQLPRRRLIVNGRQAVIKKAEIVTVYDIDLLQSSQIFLTAIRIAVTLWYPAK